MAHVLRDEFGVTKGTPVGHCDAQLSRADDYGHGHAPLSGLVTVFVNAWWTTDELDYALQRQRCASGVWRTVTGFQRMTASCCSA